MDPKENPFSPGAGSPPPELVGRNEVIEKADILFARVLKRKSEKSLLMVGLRGVGKTVLLNELRIRAQEVKYRAIMVEAHENKGLAELFIPQLRSLLFELDRIANLNDKVKKGLRVLKSFISGIKMKVGEIEFGLDIDSELGAADSGDLESDLQNVFIAVADAAQTCGVAIALFIDEIQYLSEKELSALIMAMHKMQQLQYPLVLVGAGLPILTRLAGESKSYAERLFEFPEIGPLNPADATKALQEPVKISNAKFEENAIKEIIRLTQGYPYFIQEWGYQSWNAASDRNITLNDIKKATPQVIMRLDNNFFRVRFDRLTPSEKKFLRAMAELGPNPHRSGDIAEILKVKINSLGPVRANLINKGMIYSPAYGEMAFSVPLFDEYMLRTMPAWD
jgi:hypothetical protein